MVKLIKSKSSATAISNGQNIDQGSPLLIKFTIPATHDIPAVNGQSRSAFSNLSVSASHS